MNNEDYVERMQSVQIAYRNEGNQTSSVLVVLSPNSPTIAITTIQMMDENAEVIHTARQQYTQQLFSMSFCEILCRCISFCGHCIMTISIILPFVFICWLYSGNFK